MQAGNTARAQARVACKALLVESATEYLAERAERERGLLYDVVLVFHGGTAAEIERQANAAFNYAQRWGDVLKLKFAAAKTNALVVTNKLKHTTTEHGRDRHCAQKRNKKTGPNN